MIKVRLFIISLLLTIVSSAIIKDQQESQDEDGEIDSAENSGKDESTDVDEDGNSEEWAKDSEFNEDEIERKVRQAKFKNYEVAGLNCHNKFRALHGDPKMKLDPRLNKIAQDYAYKLARAGGTLIHSKNKDYGENLAGGYPKMTPVQNVEDACKRWYNEIKDYNFNKPGFSMKTGHFTAMIWKATTHLGIGVATVNGKTVIVANYKVFPNMANKFKANVLRAKSG